ncbi:MAG: ABC transporter permease, partial [Clostridiales bacterium]|nr:ABC transporter permease [Clostridiales bacterium]
MYSFAEYFLTMRETVRTVRSYQGVLSVEHGILERPDIEGQIDSPLFLLSDPKSPVAFDEYYVYDSFHQRGLSKTDLEAVASLPYITETSARYMGAGVSPDYYRLDNMNDFNNQARVVFEATYEYAVDNPQYPLGMSQWQEGQNAHDLYFRDIDMLAGNPDWLLIPDAQAQGNQSRLRVYTYSPEFIETRNERYFFFFAGFARSWINGTNRYTTFYWQFNLDVNQLEQLVPGKRYIFVGRVEPFPTDSDFYHFMLGDDTLYDWWPYITPLDDRPENYLESEAFLPLRELIQVTNDDLHTFDVVYTDNMKTIRRVADEKILPVEGRFLTPEDSESRNPVCVISDALMKEYGLKIGDKLGLKLGSELFEQYVPLGAVASLRDRYAKDWADAVFQIVGSYIDTNIQKLREEDYYWAYSDNTVFVPQSFLPVEQSVLNGREFKPGEMSFVIGDARNIRAFIDECIPKLEAMGLTVYFSDGGWLGIEEQVLQAGSLSVSKLIAFAAVSVLALALTVYLFIGRKKREYAIMRALGTTKRKSARALFLPLALIALLSLALGGIAAMYYTGRTAADILKDFSDLGLEIDRSVPVFVAVFGMLGELAVFVLMTVFGLFRIGSRSPLTLLQESENRNANVRKKKERTGVRNAAEHKVRAAGFPAPTAALKVAPDFEKYKPPEAGINGAVSHALRHITRHSGRAPGKSLLVIAITALLIGAMGQFTVLRHAYHALYRKIEVTPRFISGMPFAKAQKIAESGFVHSPYYEDLHREGEAEFIHSDLYMTSDISRVTSAPIEYVEGYDESFVMLRERICAMPQVFMAELGLTLGDTVRINQYGYLDELRINNPRDSEEQLMEKYNRRAVDCVIVGRIMSDSKEKTVYLPIMTGDYFRMIVGELTLDLAEYVLEDYHKADEFEKYAKNEIDSIRKKPPTFLMDTSEADNIYKIYRLIGTLYPIAMAVAILLGGALPGLIVLQSAKEASIMRVLGTTKKRTRLMLILEQLMLCLLGLVVALVLLAAVNGTAILHVAKPLG